MQLVFKNNKPSEIFSQCRFFFAVIFEKFPDSSRVGTKPSFFVFGAQSGSNSCIGVPSILMRIMPFISQEIQVSSESNIDRGSFVFLQVKISIDQGQHRRLNWQHLNSSFHPMKRKVCSLGAINVALEDSCQLRVTLLTCFVDQNSPSHTRQKFQTPLSGAWSRAVIPVENPCGNCQRLAEEENFTSSAL